MPERPMEAREELDNAMELAAGAVTEGLDSVQGLRASTVQRNDLARAISTLGQELKNDPMMITNPDCVSAMMGKE